MHKNTHSLAPSLREFVAVDDPDEAAWLDGIEAAQRKRISDYDALMAAVEAAQTPWCHFDAVLDELEAEQGMAA